MLHNEQRQVGTVGGWAQCAGQKPNRWPHAAVDTVGCPWQRRIGRPGATTKAGMRAIDRLRPASATLYSTHIQATFKCLRMCCQQTAASFLFSRMRRMAPRNGLFRTLEWPVSGCKTAHSGSPNGTCRQLAEWQRVVLGGSLVAQKHRIATATGPQQRNQTAAAGPASQLLGRCKPKKT